MDLNQSMVPKKNIVVIIAFLSCLAFFGVSSKAWSEKAYNLDQTSAVALLGSELIELIKRKMGSMNMATNPSTNTFREFPPCSSDLKMLPIFGGWKTVKILCDGEVKWDTNVRTNLVQVSDTFTKVDEKVSKTSGKSKLPKIKVVVLQNDLKAGQIISELDVKLLEVEKFLSGSYFTDISKVLGRKLKVSTKKHKILKERSLLPNWTLTKDQPIIIEAKNTSFSVYADGIALSNGFLGDLIKVRNTSSGLVIDAIVVSQKKVHPITNIDNN